MNGRNLCPACQEYSKGLWTNKLPDCWQLTREIEGPHPHIPNWLRCGIYICKECHALWHTQWNPRDMWYDRIDLLTPEMDALARSEHPFPAILEQPAGWSPLEHILRTYLKASPHLEANLTELVVPITSGKVDYGHALVRLISAGEIIQQLRILKRQIQLEADAPLTQAFLLLSDETTRLKPFKKKELAHLRERTIRLIRGIRPISPKRQSHFLFPPEVLETLQSRLPE